MSIRERRTRRRPTQPRSATRTAIALLLALLTTGLVAAPMTEAAPRSKAPRSKGAKPPTAEVPAPYALSYAPSGAPAKVDLTRWAVEAGDQGSLNTCVAWTVGHSLMGWWANRTGQPVSDFAPLSLYPRINGGKDEGAFLGAGLKEAHARGVDTAAHYAEGHAPGDWRSEPTPDDLANAADYKLGGAELLFSQPQGAGFNGVRYLKHVLSTGFPVAIDFLVRDGFEDLDGARSTTVPLDDDTTTDGLGYHDVLALGYDDRGLLVQNSWGKEFGANGYARLSWDVVRKDVVEAWTAAGWGPDSSPVMPTLGSLVQWRPPGSPGTAPVVVIGTVKLFDARRATVTFRWGPTAAYGTTQTQEFVRDQPDDNTNAFGFSVSGLAPGTTYHYDVTVTTADGKTVRSGPRTFVSGAPPLLRAIKATPRSAAADGTAREIVSGEARLFGEWSGFATLEWGRTTAYGTRWTQLVEHDPSRNTIENFAWRLRNLVPGRRYHYRITMVTDLDTVTTEDRTFIAGG